MKGGMMWTKLGLASLIGLFIPLSGVAQEADRLADPLADRLAGGPAGAEVCTPATVSNEPVEGLRVTRSYGAPSGEAAYRAGSLCVTLPGRANLARSPEPRAQARAEARTSVRIVTVRDRRGGTSPYVLGAPRP